MFKFLAMMILSVATLFLILPQSAHASFPQGGFETQDLGGDIWVHPSSTESLSLSGPHYIKNLVIQAEGARRDSTIEVMVNGQVKGTIRAPGSDPSYIVTIAETTRSIEFRHRGGGSMHVIDVVATLSQVPSQPIDRVDRFGGSREQVIRLASSALQQIEYLRTFAAPDDERTYLFPIKKNAGLVYVMSTAHGNLSKKTIDQLVALSDQIAFADAYLNKLMLLDGAFDSVVELFTVRETIRSLLN
jgi:hypothetical protein